MAIFEKGAVGKILTGVMIIVIGTLSISFPIYIWKADKELDLIKHELKSAKEERSDFKAFIIEQRKQNISIAKIEPAIKAIDDRMRQQQKTLDLILRMQLEGKRANYKNIDSSSKGSVSLCVTEKKDDLF